jgi:hypothetical protein
VLAVIWVAGVATWELARPASAADTPLCLFRRVTGVPCATCGSTRSVRAIARGEPLEAIALNPLFAALLLAAVAWAVLRIGLGRRVRLDLTARQRGWLWALLAAAFAANWVWVVVRAAGSGAPVG